MSDEKIDEIMKKLAELESRLSTLEGRTDKRTAEDKKLSVKEFLLTKKPTDNVQRTLAIGYYLEHFESMDRFNVRDLTDGFRSAKEPPPININDKVNMNIRKGYMMETKEKKDKSKAWVLTNSGEEFVEKGLSEGE
jgi:hypothetical protein